MTNQDILKFEIVMHVAERMQEFQSLDLKRYF